ncbi:MAG: hypothetical protein C0154_09820 [Mucilaginibacter sp.]|nr:MAG: hypothetical protein BGO48_01915 [Mucilaginibacter sp. 44-25]PLW89779.1 MAG: hypothetical protein C0154_09820 [Mucilaginibacter sp.]
MGWFGRNKLADEVFDLEVEKTYGKWDFRLKNYPGVVIACFILIVAILVFVGISKNHDKNLSGIKSKQGMLFIHRIIFFQILPTRR